MIKDLMKTMKKIKLLLLDVDGVLTDGKIIYDSDDREIKVFHVRDGYGVVLWRKAGNQAAILSARSAKPVIRRAVDLRIDKVYQDAYPKMSVYPKVLKDFGLKDEEVCFIGDDLPDLGVLKRVGLAVTVADATPEVKKVAHYVTKNKGGNGAVREVVEKILKAQGKWAAVVRAHA